MVYLGMDAIAQALRSWRARSAGADAQSEPFLAGLASMAAIVDTASCVTDKGERLLAQELRASIFLRAKGDRRMAGIDRTSCGDRRRNREVTVSSGSEGFPRSLRKGRRRAGYLHERYLSAMTE